MAMRVRGGKIDIQKTLANGNLQKRSADAQAYSSVKKFQTRIKQKRLVLSPFGLSQRRRFNCSSGDAPVHMAPNHVARKCDRLTVTFVDLRRPSNVAQPTHNRAKRIKPASS